MPTDPIYDEILNIDLLNDLPYPPSTAETPFGREPEPRAPPTGRRSRFSKHDPLLTPARATWFGGLVTPGSGSAMDVAGEYPAFPAKEATIEEMVSGPKMPSYAENVRQKEWLDAGLQGLGVAGDAMFALPLVGWLPAATAKTFSTTARALRAAFKADITSGTNAVPKVDWDVRYVTKNKDGVPAGELSVSEKTEQNPAVSLIDLAMESHIASGAINPNKSYPVKFFIDTLRKYGYEGGQGHSRNIQTQLDEGLGHLDLSGNVVKMELGGKEITMGEPPPKYSFTPDEFLREVKKGKPRIETTKAEFTPENYNFGQFSWGEPELLGETVIYTQRGGPKAWGVKGGNDLVSNWEHSPFVPEFPNPRTTRESLTRKVPVEYGEVTHNYWHPEQGEAPYEGKFRASYTHEIAEPTSSEVHKINNPAPPKENRIFHSRYNIYDIDGQRLMYASEGQADAYKFFGTADEAANSPKIRYLKNTDQSMDMNMSIADEMVKFSQTPNAGDLTRFRSDLDLKQAQDLEYGFEPHVTTKNWDDWSTKVEKQGSVYEINDLYDDLLKIADEEEFAYRKLLLENEQSPFFNNPAHLDGVLRTEALNRDAMGVTGSASARFLNKEPQRTAHRHVYDTLLELDKRKIAKGQPSLYDMPPYGQDLPPPHTGSRETLIGQGDRLKITFNDQRQAVQTNIEEVVTIPVRDDINLPAFNEWFPLHVKTMLQTGATKHVNAVRFPVNGRAVTHARVEASPMLPRQFIEEQTTGVGGMQQQNRIFDYFSTEPSEKAINLGKTYDKHVKKALKQMEREYGIEIPWKYVEDSNGQKFIEIDLNSELAKDLEIVHYNRGGAVYKKPLMNLKY